MGLAAAVVPGRRAARYCGGMSQRRLYPFAGGLCLELHKDETRNNQAVRLSIPDKLVLPLRQHVGIAAQPCVEIGQAVLKGELIAEAQAYVGMRVHAPSSGVISAIDQFPVVHPSGKTSTCIELTTDGRDSAVQWRGVDDPVAIGAGEIYDRIAQAGIVGLGGVGFPAHVKLREGSAKRVDILIINGVECEPYITCDDRLICEHPAEVLAGAALIARAIDARACIVAVENDMSAALAALEGAAHALVELVSVPAVYPAGGEKQLITVLIGREVPSGLLPIDVGVIVLNVATVVAIYRAVTTGQPLIERIVTVAGQIPARGNVEVLVGTPVRHVLEHFGVTDTKNFRVLSGGPMMGIEIHDLRAPITKTTNCILLLQRDPAEHSVSTCIRCGDCVRVCPIGLHPQQLFDAARTSDFDAVQDLHLFDCIDCGCCAYVCPSRIPLVHYFRSAKSSIEALDRDRGVADDARARYEAHQVRASDAGQSASSRVALTDISAMDPAEVRREVQQAVARVRQRRQDESDGQ